MLEETPNYRIIFGAEFDSLVLFREEVYSFNLKKCWNIFGMEVPLYQYVGLVATETFAHPRDPTYHLKAGVIM